MFISTKAISLLMNMVKTSRAAGEFAGCDGKDDIKLLTEQNEKDAIVAMQNYIYELEEINRNLKGIENGNRYF